jgi:hypothetical protein
MKPIIRILAVTAALLPAACADPAREARTPVDPSAFNARGDVRAFAERWGIVAAPGEVYEPVNLPPAFQQEGMRVRFTAVPVPSPQNPGSIGLPVELKAIERE